MHGTILEVGPIVIRSYALMLTIAFLVGTILAVRRAKKYGIVSYEVTNLAVVIIIASIVGSRILYVFEHIKVFSKNPSSILFIGQGGFSYHGGLFFAIICVFWWLNRKKISFGRMADILSPSVALGFVFVRIGCFLNGCCFGNPTDMPWGVVFPSNSPAGWVHGSTKIHPTQLYEALSGVIAFLIILWLEKKYKLCEGIGLLFLIFLILSTLWRFLIEFFRYHEPNSITVVSLTAVQLFCIGIFIFSMTIVTQIYKKKKK